MPKKKAPKKAVPRKPRGKHGRGYTPAEREKAKQLYETGNYTFPTLSAKTKISEPTLAGWSSKYKWVKGATAAEIEAEVEWDMRKALVKKGLTPDYILTKLADALEAPASLARDIASVVEGKEAFDTKTLMTVYSLVKRLPQEMRIVLEAIKHWRALSGSDAPTKLEGSGFGGETQKEPPPDLSTLSDSELRTWIKLQTKACGKETTDKK